jgi:hypothetical protein
MRTWAASAVALAVSFGCAGPAAAATSPLAGEVLSAHGGYAGPISGVCTANPDGSTSYSLDFAGTAHGPFPGTFSEHVAVTIGPATVVRPMGAFPDGFDPGQGPDDYVPAGQLLTLTANFAIDSAAGDVTGTKQLTAVVPADSAHAGSCLQWVMAPTQFGTLTGAYSDVRAFDIAYSATIAKPTGIISAAGAADLQARQGRASNPGGPVFDVSDLGASFDATAPPPGPPGGGGSGGTATCSHAEAIPAYSRHVKRAMRGLAYWWSHPEATKHEPWRFPSIFTCPLARVVVRITWRGPGDKPILIAKGAKTNTVGRLIMSLELTPKGRKLRHQGRKLRVKVVARIRDTAGGSVRITERITLSPPPGS